MKSLFGHLAWILLAGGVVHGQALPAYSVENRDFQLTFPTTWGFVLGQSATSSTETDSTAIRGSAQGLNGIALMGMHVSQAPVVVEQLPSLLLTGGGSGTFTPTKDSSATIGQYRFQIADFDYDSLSLPADLQPSGLPVSQAGKMRIYAVQLSGRYFAFILTNPLLGKLASLPFADAEAALKTLVLTPDGAGIHADRAMRLRRFGHGPSFFCDAMGRRSYGTRVTQKRRPTWVTSVQ